MKWAVVVLAVLGCGGAEPPASNVAPETAPKTPAVQARSPERLARDLAAGTESFVNYVEPEAGVGFAEYFVDPSEQDPRAGADGLVRDAKKLCGAQLADRLADLAQTLRRKLEAGAGIECTGAEAFACTFAALGEYDLDAELAFESRDGRPVLQSVVQIEGGPVTEEFRRDAASWAQSALDHVRNESCAP